MPWNDNSDSGSTPGPKDGKKPEGSGDPKPSSRPGPKPSPWGAPPSGGPSSAGPTRRPGGSRPNRGLPPPDFSDLSGRLRERFGGYFGDGGRGMQPRGLAIIAGAIFGIWTLTGFYIVQPNEQAVVTTFGAYSGWNGPGWHYHAPAPIQAVEKISTTTLNRMDIGGRADADNFEESLMLTGDENIVDLDFTVQWRVAQGSKFLFNLRDPDTAIRAVAESSMREVIGATPLQSILTTGRGEVQRRTAQLMQRVLDGYDVGVYVNEVQIRNASPPPKVIDAFREVATAGQNAESSVNVARGEAAKIIQAARGYRAQVTQEAQGEAARFNQIYEQYRQAPAVTRQRLYIETMERVLAHSNTVMIDSKGASAPIILPPDVFKPRTPTPTTGTTQAAPR